MNEFVLCVSCQLCVDIYVSLTKRQFIVDCFYVSFVGDGLNFDLTLLFEENSNLCKICFRLDPLLLLS
jgi:hypothetical protein